MASSSPPVLPISNPQAPISSTTTTTNQSQPPIATPAFRAFITRLTDSARLAFSQRRPWSKLVDQSAFTRPESLTDAASRFRKNFSYFRINYLTLLASVLAISLVTHPVSLLL
ncbi:hypothetical protein AQUCO_02100095v1 [Aquilegia coerulea]|uniref:PRA1 family protein n=1 Tax=Aquilegia coerulea TaxID=218851 RepID=A0A2G5DES8_AQUCA|nr:hypothetical protein AQUCO_02100095v1 [Aquilegia coerulea]